jgi:hypothetical protein
VIVVADSTGFLIVRLWVEPSAPEGFRARITQTLDSTSREQAVATAGRAQDVSEVVRAWVEAFATR